MESPAADPLALFAAWFEAAQAAEPSYPEAVQLATVDGAGRPSVRTVLVKAWGADGFDFYTNLHSEKGTALAQTGAAELLFYWKSEQRQVRARGPVAPVPDAVADAYFATRPRESRLSAWASRQSAPMAERGEYLARLDELRRRFPGEVPRPPFWSGFRLAPERFEFWEERAFRQHERWTYTRDRGGGWRFAWLYP